MDEIIHGDCLDVLPTLDADSIDAIITDPPYFRVKNLPWDRQWNTAEGFLAWLDDVLAEFQRVLKPNGSLYVFASPRMAARVEVLTGERFNVRNHITWAKPDPYSEINPGASNSGRVSAKALRAYYPNTERVIFAEPYGADGSYKTHDDEIRAGVFEPLRAWLDNARRRGGVSKPDVDAWLGTNGMAGHYFGASQWALPTRQAYEIMQAHAAEFDREYEDLRREYEDLRRPFNATADRPYTDVWTYQTVQPYPGKHPAEKPQAMLRDIIRTSTRPGMTILDAFAGSGSTLQAARDLGRHYIGIEKDTEWVAYARQRLRNTEAPLLAAD